MKVSCNQVFNLMDTNGRRGDVINALQGYLQILDELINTRRLKWGKMPESLAEYHFYRKAVELSPDVFQVHKPLDNLMAKLEQNPELLEALNQYNTEMVRDIANKDSGGIINDFDKGIEDRARHFTSNLVKLGFIDSERKISPVGELLLDLSRLEKDGLEATLPIDGVNIVYLRQLLKLRIFDNNNDRFYSPLCFAIYALIKKQRIEEKEFGELIQGMSPYLDIPDIDDYIEQYHVGDIVDNVHFDIPFEIRSQAKISKSLFFGLFKNKKSSSVNDIYWSYYEKLYAFSKSKSKRNLGALLSFYEENKDKLNKAFGRGQNIFKYRKGERPSVAEFLEEYDFLLQPSVNEYSYIEFMKSKMIDQMREYSDTTKRMFNATGIIVFDKGYVELAYRELCECIFDKSTIRNMIFGKISEEMNPYYDDYSEYEDGLNSYFCEITSIKDILQYYDEEEKAVKSNISKEFDGASIEEIPEIVINRRKEEFIHYIEEVYPKDKVKELLCLFKDRSNDDRLKEIVCKEATIPTIYEYIVGMAWFYFSGKKIDLLSSYNLTLSANFEPLIHAGGGQGDIVIFESDKVVMLEATLMNSNSQKRGEWEPVLRHSINLKIDEEIKDSGREVTSFFIADEFDFNTINIWKAVASVPLQSSIDKTKFTDNVVIMPISSLELCELMDKSDDYDDIVNRVHGLFDEDKRKFNVKWRDDFIEKII